MASSRTVCLRFVLRKLAAAVPSPPPPATRFMAPAAAASLSAGSQDALALVPRNSLQAQVLIRHVFFHPPTFGSKGAEPVELIFNHSYHSAGRIGHAKDALAFVSSSLLKCKGYNRYVLFHPPTFGSKGAEPVELIFNRSYHSAGRIGHAKDALAFVSSSLLKCKGYNRYVLFHPPTFGSKGAEPVELIFNRSYHSAGRIGHAKAYLKDSSQMRLFSAKTNPSSFKVMRFVQKIHKGLVAGRPYPTDWVIYKFYMKRIHTPVAKALKLFWSGIKFAMDEFVVIVKEGLRARAYEEVTAFCIGLVSLGLCWLLRGTPFEAAFEPDINEQQYWEMCIEAHDRFALDQMKNDLAFIQVIQKLFEDSAHKDSRISGVEKRIAELETRVKVLEDVQKRIAEVEARVKVLEDA